MSLDTAPPVLTPTLRGFQLDDSLRDALASLGPSATVDTSPTGPVLWLMPADLTPAFNKLRNEPGLAFDMLVDVTAVDWVDQKPERFEVVYHLMNTESLQRLRVKVPVSEDRPEVPSMSSLWASAMFLEREVWDMMGIRFAGHPDLRRILMYEEFVGHPLRKDYPLQAKQPRVPLRAPEVVNTARQMQRPALVQIGNKSERLREARSV
jgi:NADH-quinone oxidoreductase subunit C